MVTRWVAESAIEKELNELKEYREFANSCSECQKQKSKCIHPQPSLAEKIQGLFQASYMRPMIIVSIASAFGSFAGIHHLGPYLVQILNTYETPISPADSTVCDVHSVRIFYYKDSFNRLIALAVRRFGLV